MILTFGEYELDEDLYELRRGGLRVKIEPKAFDMLAYLIRNRERVITREELLEKLWPGEFVSESALSYCIKAVRRAVNDTGAEQGTIKTLHGRGYRWMAPVESRVVEAPPPKQSISELKSPAAEERPAAARFVGRRREMELANSALEAAISGTGRLVLLMGEPGIGKTRMADELAANAQRHGAQVLIGRCYEGEGAPAFWPWVQVIRSYVMDRSPDRLRSEMAEGAADIAHVVPAVARRLPGLPSPPVLEPGQARFRFFDSVTNFLKNASRSQSLMIVLDDLHWADRDSLLLLKFFAAELASAPIFVLGTYRDVEVHREHPLVETTLSLRREQISERILLRGLVEADVEALLSTVGGRELPEAFVHTICRDTEGNPFFIKEIFSHLVETHILYREGDRWVSDLEPERMGIPESVRALIGHRLARLSNSCRRLLAIGSVLGREFELSPLVAVWEKVGGQDTESSQAVTLQALDEALAARIVEKAPRGLQQYRFAHALVRETLYEELASDDRTRLHHQVGEALEMLFSEEPEPHLVELAHHFIEAAPGGGSIDKALQYATRVAERATSLFAYEHAVDHYQMALRALPYGGASGSDAQRTELLLALGEAQWRAGNTQVAKETFQRAATIARKLAAPEQLARAAMGFSRPMRIAILDPAVVQMLEDALQALGESDSALRARTMARLCWALCSAPDSLPRRLALSEDAVQIARRVTNPLTLAWALHDRHWALWRPENLEDRIATATELVQVAQHLGDNEMVVTGRGLRFVDLLELGHIAGVEAELALYTELADRLRQPWYQWYALRFQATRMTLIGELRRAEDLAARAFEIGKRVDEPAAMQIHAWQLLTLRSLQGDSASMRGPLKELSERYPMAPVWQCALAFASDSEEAQRILDQLSANTFAAIPRDLFWSSAMALCAEIAVRLNDAEKASALFDLLLPYAKRFVVIGVGAACFGSVSRLLGKLAAVRGELGEIDAYFEDAITAHSEAKAKTWLALSEFEYANLLVRRARSADLNKARTLAQQATTTAEALGLTMIAGQAQALLPRTTARRR